MAATEHARLARYRAGVPVYSYVADPATPPVSVMRFDPATHHPDRERPHIHDFPALLYVARDAETGWLAEARPRAGDLYLVSPGQVVQAETAPMADSGAVAVFFTPEALGGGDRAGWAAHPLLFPFLHGARNGVLRLRVPEEDRSRWLRGIAALEDELAGRRDGYRQAALAHLTLLLVDTARLANDVVGGLRRNDEPLLAEVFGVIERRHRERLSLRDVARAVNLTPGHLTTVVRRRTGRTVQDWITEQRMTSARRLLAETDLPVGEVAGRVGYPDPAYFARTFRRAHGSTPREWRAAAG